jgi:hypothetical protein
MILSLRSSAAIEHSSANTLRQITHDRTTLRVVETAFLRMMLGSVIYGEVVHVAEVGMSKK